jgi:hypothetical protein
MNGMKLPAEWFEMIRPARSRLWLIRAMARMKLAVWGALGWMLLVLLISRIVPVAHPGTWAVWGGLGLTALGTGWAVFSRPGWSEAIRAADRALRLEDRLITAWQMRDREEPMAVLQREDALERLRRQRPELAERMPLVWGTRREGWAAAAAVCLLSALLFLPNPLTEQALKRERIQTLISQRAEKVEKWKETALKDHNIRKETKEAIRKELNRLSERLKEARNLEEVALELARSDERLRQLREQSERQSLPARRIAEEWQNGSLSALGKAMQNGKAVSEAEIKRAIRQMKPEERKKLAKQLDRLARDWSAADDTKTRQAAELLRSAADALAAEASGAEDQASRALAAAQEAIRGQQADARMLAEGSQMLSGEAVALASGSGSQGGPADGTPFGGSPSQSGSGSGTSAGNGTATGAGTSSGGGSQGGGGQGSGNSSGGGQGGSGSGGGSGAGTGAGSMVLVPWSRLSGEGQRGTLGGTSGGGTDTDAGTVSATPGLLRPYGEVFASYEAEAREALERGEIPPELEWLVREYFSTLEP